MNSERVGDAVFNSGPRSDFGGKEPDGGADDKEERYLEPEFRIDNGVVFDATGVPLSENGEAPDGDGANDDPGDYRNAS